MTDLAILNQIISQALTRIPQSEIGNEAINVTV